MFVRIVLISLLIAGLLQGVRIFGLPIPDARIWSMQAEYVHTGDTRQYDFLGGYGHPGGPLIEGTVALHAAGFSFETALLLTLFILSILFTVGIAITCHILRPQSQWWLIQTVSVSISWLYIYSTPTTILASLIALQIFLLTWLMYEVFPHKRKSRSLLILWAICLGMLVAVRIDIGSILAVSFASFLYFTRRLSWKELAAATGSALLVFCICDPYMWSIPIEHVMDLFSKVIFQMYYYPLKDIGDHSSFLSVLLLSATSILVTGISYLNRKKTYALPWSMYLVLLSLTIAFVPVIAMLRYASERYFLPLAFIWEAILPITLLSAAPNRKLIQLISWAPACFSFAFTLFLLMLEIAYTLAI